MKKTSVRILTTLLILCLLTTGFAFGALPEDVQGKSYEAAVEALMERGAITGDTDGLYHPEATLTRAQACVIIVRTIDPPEAELLGTPTQSVPDSGFTDMAGYGWAAPYINYAVANGITNGVGGGKFAPGASVKSTELITFVLRAMGYTDQTLGGTWPQNYLDKKQELNLEENMPEEMPELATKWMTAQLVYNGMEEILEAQGTAPSTEGVITTGLSYASGSFNSDITTFDGKPLASDVAVYTYSKQSQYKSTMTLPSTKGSYGDSTVYKYKNVATPAFYLTEGGKITQIILPADVGFSGSVYGVVNKITQVKNAEGDTVYAVYSMAAGREITWLCEKGYNPTTDLTDRVNGEVFKMVTRKGVIQSGISKATTSATDDFVEYTTGATVVHERDDLIVRLTNASGPLQSMTDNAAVYIFKPSDDSYTVGKMADVRKDRYVRMFKLSDEEAQIAEIIVVSETTF